MTTSKESRQIDYDETVAIARSIEARLEELKYITGSNGIGARKIHGKKKNSVREEIEAMLISLARIRISAREHAAE